jgi:hypothetical protein
MIFVPALVGAFLPQTLLAKIENFRSLAYGKGDEKIHFFILTDRSDCAENYRHQPSQGYGELQSPSSLSACQNLRMSYWQPRRNLLFAFLQYHFNNKTKKSSE